MGDAEDTASAFGGGRMSAQRRAIARTAGEMRGAFTVDDLIEAAQAECPGLGTATVYRAVAAMQASGFLEPVGSRDGSTLYLRCTGTGHHHHLVCTGCGAVALTECPLALGALAAAQDGGYVVTSHEVTIYGLCPECAPRGGDATDPGTA